MNTTLQIDGLEVIVEGEGAETIVMVHGWPDTYRLWDAQVAHLSAHFRCVRFTLPGFDIARPRLAYSLAQCIDTLKHVVEQTCPGGQAVLMLHDWGCFFGYQFLMRHPSLVSKVIGIDVGDSGSKAHVATLGLRAKAMLVAYQLWLAAAWRIDGGLGDWMTKWMARAARCRSDPRFIGSQMNYPYYIRWTGRHGSYREARKFDPPCPMLFVYGTRKPFLFHSPPWAEALAKQPGSAVLALDCGHWVMVDRAQPFNEAVLAWLGPAAATIDR